jgi:sulfate adenylyltransferase subunit 1 (EFTu-like GTPase family)
MMSLAAILVVWKAGRIVSGTQCASCRPATSHASAPSCARRSLERAKLHDNVAIVLEDALDIYAWRPDGGLRSRTFRGHRARGRPLLARQRLADPRRTYLLRHTTREVPARVEKVLSRWNVANGNMTTDRRKFGPTNRANPSHAAAARMRRSYRRVRSGGSFVLVDPSSNATVAGGMVPRLPVNCRI